MFQDFIHNEAMDEIVCSCDWDQCGVLLTSREELIRHFGQHHDPQLLGQADRVKDVETGKLDRIWSCRWGNCSKTCNRLENLRCHIRTHTGDKPFACSFEGCTKAFTNASDRTKHENRTHLGLKSFPCSLDGCQKCYTDQSSLRKHIKHSHGEHEFELCKKVRKRMKPMPSESLTQDRQSPQTATLPVTASPFTPDQINALKMVADSLLAGIAAFPHLRNQVPTVLKAESVCSSNYAFTVPTLTNPTTAFEVVDHEKTSRVPAAMLNPADISLFAEEATVKQGPTAKPLPFFDDPEKMKQYRDPETNNMLDDYLLQLSLDQTPSACTLFEEEYEEDV